MRSKVSKQELCDWMVNQFFFSSRRRHTMSYGDWSSDVCSSDLVTEFPKAMEVLAAGKTLRLLESDLPFPFRLMFNSILGGRAALVAPVRVAGHTFGFLGLVWSEARQGFQDHEVALVEGIADQCGTALERDQLSAEVMHLRDALHERYGEDRIIGQTPVIRRAIELALSVADTQT